MRIAEVFASIQGEGILSGVPSLFMRLSGCNLRCRWCDTPYTSWAPEGEEWSLERVMEWVGRHPQYRHVVITGGEPMLFADTVPLSRACREAGLHVTIETAATVYQPVTCDLMSLSPKLANSTPTPEQGGKWTAAHERLRHQPDVVRRLMAEYPYQLKFVVSEPGDVREILAWVDEMGPARDRVLLMPEGISADELRVRGGWVVELCKTHGFRYCPRLHVELYGNARGV